MHFFIINFRFKGENQTNKILFNLTNLKSLSLCKGSGGTIIRMLKYLMYLHKN